VALKRKTSKHSGSRKKEGTPSPSRATSSPLKFPAYVAAAMAAAAQHTKVPVLAPLWLPTHGAGGSLVRPQNGTFAAVVTTSKDQDTIQFWPEPHPLSVNNPEVVQDSTDPALEPLVSITGAREPNRRAARNTVLKMDWTVSSIRPCYSVFQKMPSTRSSRQGPVKVLQTPCNFAIF